MMAQREGGFPHPNPQFSPEPREFFNFLTRAAHESSLIQDLARIS